MPTSPGSDEPADRGDGPSGDAEVAAARAGTAGLRDEIAGLRDEIAGLRDELARTQDRHRRALADLDNYRKRVERDGDRRAEQARRTVLRDWLDAVDSVELALRQEPGDPGLTAVLAQMESILARHGIARLDAVGARFDPELHEAIAVQPDAANPEHTVLQVARSGFGGPDGEVLRPAQVVVSRRPADEH